MANGSNISLADLREEAPTAERATATSAKAPGKFRATQADVAYAGTQAADGSRRADQGTATGYNAQTGEIDPASMTAAGQLESITGKDSPLMRRAAERGLLTAGKRGLENSSFAAGAAMGEMVDRAAPIAAQDAQTYFQNMRANLEAENRASEVSTGRETEVDLFNAQAQNQLEALNAQLETAVNQGNAEAANRLKEQITDIRGRVNMLNAELGTQTDLANTQAQNQLIRDVLGGNQELNRQFLAGTQAIDLAAVQGRYQQLISSNNAAAQIYNSYISAIGQAMANHEVTPGRIAQYVNVMAQQMEGSLEMIDAMNALNLGDVDVPGARSSGGGKGGTIRPGYEPPAFQIPYPGLPASGGGLSGAMKKALNELARQNSQIHPDAGRVPSPTSPGGHAYVPGSEGVTLLRGARAAAAR